MSTETADHFYATARVLRNNAQHMNDVAEFLELQADAICNKAMLERLNEAKPEASAPGNPEGDK